MVEPQGIGFTGRVWDAVPGERLARELTTGPGSAPMAEAGVAWANLAGGLVDASAEYQLIVDQVRQAWRSTEGDAAAEQMTNLIGWLNDAAASATSNGLKAETQAGAYEIARLTMPDAQEIAATETLKDNLLQGSALGGPLIGIAATIENDAEIAKKQAARVMQTYEAATAPLAAPWHQAHPPKISAGAALAAERAGRELLGATREGAFPRATAEMPRLTALDQPVVESDYTGEQLGGENADADLGEAAGTPVPVHEVGAPGAPVMAGPGASTGAVDEEHVMRAGLALADRSGVDRLGLDVGFATAPAVLGATPVRVVPVLPEQVESVTEAP